MSFPSGIDFQLRGRQLAARLEELSRVSDEPGRLVRTFLSPASIRAEALVGRWMAEAGLTVSGDDFGNLIGTRSGPPGCGTFVIGSHLDTVVDAGWFDGPMGVLLGVAAAEILTDIPFTLEVVGFSDEEGVRFQSTYLGSRAFGGLITPAELALRGADGVSVGQLVEARSLAGFPAAGRTLNDVFGYLEIHIEQGPVLEDAGLPLGVVPGIAGQSRVLAGFTGKAGHAGTTPMSLRRDALTAAARLVLEAEAYAAGHPPLLATVGKMEVLPGAGNVIPGEVSFTLDVRSPDDAARETALEFLHAAGSRIAADRHLQWHWQLKQSNAAVPSDSRLTEILAQAAAAPGSGSVPRIFSGAGHDAAVMAGLMPAAMLFVRCRDGLSHHPDEYASPEDMASALEAIVRFLLSPDLPPHA